MAAAATPFGGGGSGYPRTHYVLKPRCAHGGLSVIYDRQLLWNENYGSTQAKLSCFMLAQFVPFS
eukprot:4951915-Amphidinium_carterae.2